ncbi:hypothetical protein AMTRI_Chr12g268620 [Amborella trichopoda]
MKAFFTSRSRCKKEAILRWDKKVEEIEKHFLLEEFKVKQQTQCDIMLPEAELMPLEVEAICCQFVVSAQDLTTSAIDKISK